MVGKRCRLVLNCVLSLRIFSISFGAVSDPHSCPESPDADRVSLLQGAVKTSHLDGLEQEEHLARLATGAGKLTEEERLATEAAEAAEAAQEAAEAAQRAAKERLARLATEASPQAAIQKQRVIFGLMTSPLPKYAEQLAAVQETWARDVLPQNFLVVGASGSTPGVVYRPAPLCQDGHTNNAGNSCKEATIIATAHELGTDWVVVAAPDQYIFSGRWEEMLEKEDASEPQILGIHSCGEGMYCEDHKTGLCGGGAYAVSRGALANMVGGGSLKYIQECMKTSVTVGGNWSDQTVSCVARRHGVKEVELAGLYPCQLRENSTVCSSQDPMEEAIYKRTMSSSNPRALTFHYVFPDAMRKIHKLAKDLETDSGLSLLMLASEVRESQEDQQAAQIQMVDRERSKHLSDQANDQQHRLESFERAAQIASSKATHHNNLDSATNLHVSVESIAGEIWRISKDTWQSKDQRVKMIQLPIVMGIILMVFLQQTTGSTYILNALIFVLYILVSVALLYVNKGLITEDSYVHPLILVTLHMLTCASVTRGLQRVMPQWFVGLEKIQDMTSEQHHHLRQSVAMIAICFASSLVCENSAYFYSSVAFLQMMKEFGTVVVAVLAFAMGLDMIGVRRGASLVLLAVGGCMCIRGEVHLTLGGPLLQMLSNICNGTRLTLQNKLLVQDAGVKLEPLSYVALVSPFCFAVLLLPAIAMVIMHHDMLNAIKLSINTILLSCTLAVALNFLVAVIVQRTSAVSFVVLGAVKNALVILFACFALGQETTICQMLGCCLIFSSSTTYALLSQWEKKTPAIPMACSGTTPASGMDEKTEPTKSSQAS